MSARYIVPFNEYIIVSRLAVKWEKLFNNQETYASEYYQTYYGTTEKPLGHSGVPTTVTYGGYSVLSDIHPDYDGEFVASFIPQFSWYALKSFRQNPFYVEMMEQWLLTEHYQQAVQVTSDHQILQLSTMV